MELFEMIILEQHGVKGYREYLRMLLGETL